MTHSGRIYQRGDIYYVAYRWDGREYRESARSADPLAVRGESDDSGIRTTSQRVLVSTYQVLVCL